jgi:hypothetical protein
LLFAAGGLAAGLTFGLGLAIWFEVQDKSIRDERDVLAALEMPTLVSLPWIDEQASRGNGHGLASRSKGEDKPDAVEVRS